MRDVSPWLLAHELNLSGMTITQSSIIFMALIITSILVVGYRLATRRKRYHP